MKRVIQTRTYTPDSRGIHGPESAVVPLTPAQHWFLQLETNHANHYNQSMMLTRPQGYDREHVLAAFNTVCRLHDALRMVFKPVGQDIVQIKRPPGAITLDVEVIALDTAPTHELEARIEHEATTLHTGIDLSQGPLVKLGLFKTGNGDHLLIIIHHLVVDGVSWRILLNDFNAAYSMAEKGLPIRFHSKSVSYQLWSEQLTVYSSDAKLLKEMTHWCRIDAASAVSAQLPADYQMDPAQRKNKDTEVVSCQLDESQTRVLLKDVHNTYNTGIEDILLSALALTLCRWTSKPRIAITLEGHGREPVIDAGEITGTVGWFTTKYPVVLEGPANKDISLVIKDVKELLRSAPNRGIGYGILRYLTPASQKDNYRFRADPAIIFNFLGFSGDGTGADGSFKNSHEMQFSQMPGGLEKSPDSINPYALTINTIVIGSQCNCFFSFSNKEYRSETVTLVADGFKESMLRVIDHCLKVEMGEKAVNGFDAIDAGEDEPDAVCDEIGPVGPIIDTPI